MSNSINTLEIKNFKSIKDLKLDCKQVNLFIGEPNVGKSNILEALALLGGGYSHKKDKFLSDLIRYQEVGNLFYDGDLEGVVEVRTDKAWSKLSISEMEDTLFDYVIGFKRNPNLQAYPTSVLLGSKEVVGGMVEEDSKVGSDKVSHYHLDKFGRRVGSEHNGSFSSSFRKYDFKGFSEIGNRFLPYLLPPDGRNLFAILDHNARLKNEFGRTFKSQGLQLVLSKSDKTIELMKLVGDYSYKYPFSTMADSYQRLIFYLCAMESNKDAVLIFEEPEVHSFPPYTKWLADLIALDEENQYFIASHSPYLLATLNEEIPFDRINVIITYFKDYETCIRVLSMDEIEEIMERRYDLFFNLPKFIRG